MSATQAVSPRELKWKEESAGRSVCWSCSYDPGNARFTIWHHHRIFSIEEEKYELRCYDFFSWVDGFDKEWSFPTLEEAKEFALQIAADRRVAVQKRLAEIKREERLARLRRLRMMPIRGAYRIARPVWRLARFLDFVWEPLPLLMPGVPSAPSTEQELQTARTYLRVTAPMRKLMNWGLRP